MAVLTLGHLHYDWQQPDLPPNDHLIFRKGHASPLLYSMFRAAATVDEKYDSDHAPRSSNSPFPLVYRDIRVTSRIDTRKRMHLLT